MKYLIKPLLKLFLYCFMGLIAYGSLILYYIFEIIWTFKITHRFEYESFYCTNENKTFIGHWKDCKLFFKETI